MKYFILFFSLFLSSQITFSQTEKEKVSATISKNKIEGHIYFLADDLLKGRQIASPENKIAASYLANTLRGYGVQPVKENNEDKSSTENYYQEVKLNKVSPPSDLALEIDGKKQMNSVVLKPNKIDFTGDAIYLGYGLKEDYIGNDVSGKTIIIKSGGPNVTDTRAAFGMTEQKEELAEEHGAIAIIELLDTNDRIWGFIEHQSNGERIEIADENEAPKNITYLWIMDENNLYAKALESKKITQ